MLERIVHQVSNTAYEIRSNWIVRVSVKFSLLLVIGSFLILAWRWQNLPPSVPLWYSKTWGMEQLARPMWLFLLPLGNLVWYMVDLAIVAWQGNQYRIFTQTIFLTTFLVSFLSFVTLIKILFLVT